MIANKRAVTDHERLLAMIAERAEERRPDQRVSHPELMGAASLLSTAAEKEWEAGEVARSSEINHIVIAVFQAAIRVEDLPTAGGAS